MDPPNVTNDRCQWTVLEGLGGVGKTQIAVEAAYQVRDKHPNCSIFWVPAFDASSFEYAYRRIGEALSIPGLSDDGADVRTLVKTRLDNERTDSWLLIVDNADSLEISPDMALRDYLPSSPNGSILFTTRNRQVAVGLDITQRHIIHCDEGWYRTRNSSFKFN
ncbi:hypothetical protein GGR52DRAFT_248085 [Hypoxylon sp. FL1284]|nr:hypothetical protein GGR52DRAFT_248085 [Hypoxylon sp. FL1284]